MAESLILPDSRDRKTIYEAILPQIESVVRPESDFIANLANTASILKMAFGFFWVGFYIMREGELVLGPFQGDLACTRIAVGRGVCGTVAMTGKPEIVPDVDAFPGHIACSSASRSEVVVPLLDHEAVIGVLDVDSDQLADFSTVDAVYLSQIADLLVSLKQS